MSGTWSRTEKWTAASVIVAVIAIVITVLFPDIRKLLGLDKTSRPVSGIIQQVMWGPDTGYPAGILVISPRKEFIPWDQLSFELSQRVLRNIDQVPAGSSVRVATAYGKADLFVEVVNPDQQVIGHVWLGADPTQDFAWDGRIRVGTLIRPVVVWATYERHTDGAYIRVLP